MTTADHRHETDEYSDQATDDRRFDQDGSVDQDGSGYDTDRPAGGYGEAHDAPATGDEQHVDGNDVEHDHVQRLDTQEVDADGDSDPALTAATDGADPARTDGSYAGRHADGFDSTESRTDDTTATGDGTPAVVTTGSTATTSTSTSSDSGSSDLERLVPANRVDEYTSRWDSVKGEFVDEPRQAVAKADKLVGELLDELDQLFRKQRSDLEHGLDADETSTEDLRLALRKYRSFFDRLLAL
jgi:hypothetical protein